jgi:hypothetical protein
MHWVTAVLAALHDFTKAASVQAGESPELLLSESEHATKMMDNAVIITG